MEPKKPKPWLLLGSIALFAVHVTFLVTPPAIGGKPYGMTLFHLLPVALGIYVYRLERARYRAHRSRSPFEEDPAP
ncbi:hypothetical protein [Nocardiopsis tropica]|uniref:Uncharacterized protein n=1 Tax=Nocardiopsis tropica TaxID=109330 RepID=A0ABU7KWI1_9ACTN|nr:hypothetical protein [Nocardiopsis umidischolae]MEE2053643.1 hypothetical protein [Nocardiopsis umidischolae]